VVEPVDSKRARGERRDALDRTSPRAAGVSQHDVTDRLRFAAIVGAMKCGTASLFDHLVRHPQIAASSLKEPKYFSRDGWQNDLTAYRRIWDDFDPAVHKVLLEASTEYTKQPIFPDVASRIAQFAATQDVDFKFIYIVRDPIRMIASGLHHGKQKKWGYGSRDRLFRHLREVADFEQQISSYRKRFSDSLIQIVQLEKLVADEEAELAAIFDFLGVDMDESMRGARMVAKNTEAMRNETVAARKAIERLPARGPLKDAWAMLPEGPRKSLRPAIYRILAALGRPAPEVDEADSWALGEHEIDEIRRRLDHNIARFAERYGIDRSLWSM